MNSTTVPDHDQRSPVAVTVDELLSYRQVARSLRLRNKHRVISEKIGETHSRILGRGLDFSELREYQAGDDIRQIDWNVTARTGTPHTKLFSLEREKPCFAVIDLRQSMYFATRGAFKSVIAARLAAVLAWAAVGNNDRIGGLVFTDHSHTEIKPESGRRGLMRLFRAVVDSVQQQQEEAVSGNAFSDAVTRLNRLAHTGSTVWFLSDFAGFDDRVRAGFAGLMQHNEVTAIQITDVIESELPPPGNYQLRSGSSMLRVDTTTRHSRTEYKNHFVQMQEELRRFFSRNRHRYLDLHTHDRLEEQAETVLNRLPHMLRETENES